MLWSLGYRYAFWKFLAGLDDANERAEEVLEMIKLDRKRDALAMNLTYAEQRALEIGITIAGGADVILLDEPTAGMSKSETTRFVELIREVTVGKTLLTVEHDMGVVFGLADKIAVLVYGEVIAFDVPEAVRANPRVQEAYLGSVLADAQVAAWRPAMMHRNSTRPARLLRQEPHPARRRLGGRRGRDRQPARPQRLGPLDHRQGHHGPGRRRGLGAVQGEEILGRKAFDIAHRGIGYVPENRDIFPKLTVHQNLLLGEKRGKAQAALVASTTCTRMFPRLKERQHTEAGVLSGGEQQMLTLCRTLMGDPDLIMIDEPTEGLAPKIVELVAEYLKELQAPRRLGAAGRAEAHHRAADLRAAAT